MEGSAPALLANLLEVRGIGLLDIKTIFGETSVRRKMRLNLVAELKQFDQGELMERLPETTLYRGSRSAHPQNDYPCGRRQKLGRPR